MDGYSGWFELAEHFGLDPFVILQSWTYRQFLAARLWYQERHNRPSITEQYLMSIAAEVRRGYAKHAGRVKMEDLQLQFKFSQGSQPTPETEEELKEYSSWLKAAHMARAAAQIKAQQQGVEE